MHSKQPQMHIKSPKCYRLVGEIAICIYCSGNCIKYGLNKTRNQRYRCKNCNRTFLSAYSYTAYQPQTDTSIKEHLKEGCGIRSISRLLRISCNTVLHKIISIAKAITKPFISFGKEYEVDEMYTFVYRKSNQKWIVYALRKDTNEVADFTVGSRTNATLKRVTDTLMLSQASRICTDKLPYYRSLIPDKIHTTKQYCTNHIERNNLSIRTHLKRLSRRTICFSKSLAIINACLKIYFWG